MIEVANISHSYGKVKALEDLSFTLEPEELFGFIGPDGAGKTTLFRILTSLIVPDKAEHLRLNNFDVIKQYRNVRSCVGYMPGKFSLYPDLTVQENLSFFATVFGTTIEENYHLIEEIYIQIEPFKNRLAGRLSGGMKQKLALSCALIHEPKVLILDEPTTGVDAVSRREFWELLLGLKARGITILVSTPYMDEAQMCDRVALMQKGKILTINKPKDVEKSFPQRLYSVRSSDSFKLLRDLREYTATASVFPFGQNMHLALKDDNNSADEVVRFLEKANHRNVVMEEISAGIEDVFMQLMETK